jgi:putative membrane protein
MKTLPIVIALSAIAICSCNNSGTSSSASDTTTVRSDTSSTNNGMMATDTSANTPAMISDLDREFAMKVGMGNTGEIEAGKLAQEKSANQGVKDFGAMMVKDHGEAQDNLKNIGMRLSVSVPDSVDSKHSDLAKKLSSLSGDKFDKAYIDAQIKDHRETISLFEKIIADGKNEDLKQFAINTLPHIRMHLQTIEGLSAKK